MQKDEVNRTFIIIWYLTALEPQNYRDQEKIDTASSLDLD